MKNQIVAEAKTNQPTKTISIAKQSQQTKYIGVILAEKALDIEPPFDSHLESLSVELGSQVQKNDRLAVLDQALLKRELSIAQADLLRMQAIESKTEIALDKAQQQWERRKRLPKIVSSEDYESARFEVKLAKAAHAASQADVKSAQNKVAQVQERLEKTVIRAPFSGVVTMQYMTSGAAVRPGRPILRLVNNDGYKVRFAVKPEHAGRFKVGLPIRIAIKDTDRVLTGHVKQITHEIDPSSQMVFVEGEIANNKNPQPLRNGTVVEVSQLDFEFPKSAAQN